MRPLAMLAFTIAALAPSTSFAQRWSRDVEGSETCRDIWDQYGRTMHGRPIAVYCEIRDIGTRPASGTVSVDGGDRQGISVRGAARRDVHVSLVIQAQGRSVEDAKALAQSVKLDVSDRRIRVTGIDDEPSARHFVGVTVLLEVPVESDLSLSVGSAPLYVENVRGNMELHAEHGPLSVRNIGGNVRARVEYGPLSVDLDSSRWNGQRLDAESEYGPVTLRVPENFGADLELGAEHGPFEVDFPITLNRLDGRSPIHTKLGAGGPPVRAVARYGPMTLRKKG